ncbi:MAG: serine hydrolase [Promethearchaeota archaeon]
MNAFEEIEKKVVDLMGEFKIPGLSIGIVEQGESIYAKGFGARNIEKNLPFTENTLFGIGSISKSFTALALLQLVQEGKINLQDPVNKYLNFKLGDNKNPIKVCHLLSHSSGFPELSGNVVAIVRQLGNFDVAVPMSSWNDFFLHINSAITEVFDGPDKNFFYNNDMFTCVGLIIEKLTNMKFEAYIKKNILEPLNMHRSIYLKEDFEKDNNVLTGYIPSKEKKQYKETSHPFDKIVYAPGGLVSSVREMQNYIITLITGGVFNNSRIIQQSLIEQMWTPYIKIPEETLGGKDAWYGLGWVIEKDFFGHRLIHHGGDVGSSTAFLALLPEEKMGVIIGANCNASIVLSSLAYLVLGFLLGIEENKTIPALKIYKKLKSLTGKYSTYKKLENIDISFENDILYAEITESLDFLVPMKLPLVPEDIDELKFHVPIAYPNRKIKVQFFVEETTQKVHFTFDRYYFHKI